jgi:SagB-type dehydrogenase family enzyme
MRLPSPRTQGKVSLERCVVRRRTIRSFSSKQLSLEQFAQILWAGQGVTETDGRKRAVPSAGALYPMDLYAVVGKDGVEGLMPGVYHFAPKDHAVFCLSEGDFRGDVVRAALSQTWMAGAPLLMVITAEYVRVTGKYGTRGVRYAIIEAGHIGQNIFLHAEALDLGAGIVGAFNDQEVIRATKISPSHEPLLIMPIGFRD